MSLDSIFGVAPNHIAVKYRCPKKISNLIRLIIVGHNDFLEPTLIL